MCEMMALHARRPIPVEDVLRWATLLDEYGVAGFSWGIVWRNVSGQLMRYRAVEGIRRDPLVHTSLAGVYSHQYLVHLRRPSLMTTISFVNAQPYLNNDTQVAFAHNGYFAKHRDFRPQYQKAMTGTSDSEVGYLHYLDQLRQGYDPQVALTNTPAQLAGDANISVMHASGELLFYAGHHDNKVYAFTMEDATFVSTSLHSADDYLFQTVFPRAEEIQLVPSKTVYAL